MLMSNTSSSGFSQKSGYSGGRMPDQAQQLYGPGPGAMSTSASMGFGYQNSGGHPPYPQMGGGGYNPNQYQMN